MISLLLFSRGEPSDCSHASLFLSIEPPTCQVGSCLRLSVGNDNCVVVDLRNSGGGPVAREGDRKTEVYRMKRCVKSVSCHTLPRRQRVSARVVTVVTTLPVLYIDGALILAMSDHNNDANCRLSQACQSSNWQGDLGLDAACGGEVAKDFENRMGDGAENGTPPRSTALPATFFMCCVANKKLAL